MKKTTNRGVIGKVPRSAQPTGVLGQYDKTRGSKRVMQGDENPEESESV